MTPLSGWVNFYVIVGSSAGALIGLQFVVVTLMADMPMHDDSALAADAFGTPTVVYFGTVLFLSAALGAPWRAMAPVAAVWGLVGLIGLVYASIVARRMNAQTVYRPEFEDWLFHLLLPLAAYATLAISAYEMRADLHAALFGPAAATLLLLFIGIHNAWDAVTYHVFVQRRKRHEPEQGDQGRD